MGTNQYEGITRQQAKMARTTLFLSVLFIVVAVFKSKDETLDTILETTSYALSLVAMYFLINYFKEHKEEVIAKYINFYISVSIGIIIFTIIDLLTSKDLFENMLYLIIFLLLGLTMIVALIILCIKFITLKEDHLRILKIYGIVSLIVLPLIIILSIIEELMLIKIPSFIYIIDILPILTMTAFYGNIENAYKNQTS